MQQRDYINCIVLNDEGSFSPKSFLWRDFTIGLLPNTEARLSIFYVDFKYTNENLNDIEITSIPQIDLDVLRKGISELETALGDLPI